MSPPRQPSTGETANALPKVSVIIPVYNGERYLPECLDSIQAQDYPNLEILMADDGSTDGSLEIIKSLAAKDMRVRWWQNAHNLGQTGNHNVCIQEARGDFIKFLHQDDKLLCASAIHQQAAALVENPDAALAASASEIMDAQSRFSELRNKFKPGIWDGKQIIHDGFEAVANNIGEPSVVMFRRAQAMRGFLNEYKQFWDLEMWYHLLEQGKFAYIAESLCAFRQHSAQQSDINRRNGIIPGEMLRLLETYYARPWLRKIASQRMLINQSRFLKKYRPQLGPRADPLLADIQTQIHPASRPLYWLERKVRQPLAKINKQMTRAARGERKHV